MAGITDVQGRARARPWLTQRRREELTAYLFLAPWIIGFLIFTAGAMLFSFWISLSDTDLLTISKFIGFKNYAKALTGDSLFIKALKVTAWYTALVVPLGTLVALSIAVMLNQKLKAVGVWRTIYYLPALVSGVAIALLWGWVLNPDFGLVNLGLRMVGLGPGPRWFGSEDWAVPGMVMVAIWASGQNMVLYLAGMQSIPTEVQEAAKIDGAGPFRTFISVTLPLLTPTVFFNVITSIIASFQVFNIVVILTQGGPNNATLSLVYYLYSEGFRLFNFGDAASIAWLLFALILVFTMIVMRSSNYWVYYEGGLRR